MVNQDEMSDVMNQKLCLLQLYRRETTGNLVEAESISEEALNSAEYKAWSESKKLIGIDEVMDRVWLKSCSGGYITEVHFYPDGSLDEYTWFTRLHTKGEWELVDGQLIVTIYKGDNRYDFTVVGNGVSHSHSAIEYKNNELHSYLKLAPIHQQK